MTKSYHNSPKTHDPVLLSVILHEFGITAPLQPSTKNTNEDVTSISSSKKIFIDGTVGLAGHSVELVKSGAYVIGIDADEETLQKAEERLSKACPDNYPVVVSDNTSSCFKLIHGNFKDIDNITKECGISVVDGILLDLGVNTPQLVSETRGFSFQQRDAMLDMRLDRIHQGVTAADLLNSLDKRKLIEVFAEVTEEFRARKIAQAILAARIHKPFKTVGDLLDALDRIGHRSEKIHPATVAFMAIRMAVNYELDSLRLGLVNAFPLLRKGGKLAVISFHSGEDKIVKNYFSSLKEQNLAKVSDKPIVPSGEEVQFNPRARSAKLRIAQKL